MPDEGLITLAPEIAKLKRRLEKIAVYLEKVEDRIFKDEDLNLKPGEVLREEFKMLRQHQMEGLEFIRKYHIQLSKDDPPDMDIPTAELARQLRMLPKDQLEMIRVRLSS